MSAQDATLPRECNTLANFPINATIEFQPMTPPTPSADQQPPADRPRSGWLWRWTKRLLLAFLILLVLLVVFHQPILRWVVGFAGEYGAKKAGYSLKWDVGGSILSDLSLKNVEIEGPLGTIKFGGTHLRYDLWKFYKEGMGSLLQDFEMADAHIEIDVTTKPDKPKPPPKDPKKAGGPPDVWVGRVNLQNVNARVRTDGGDIVIGGLNLLLDPNQPGALQADQIIVPSAKLTLADVKGNTRVEGRAITFTDLILMPDLSFPLLKVDVAKLREGGLYYDLAANSGEGKILSAGEVLLGHPLKLDVTLKLQRLAHTEIARWAPLPPDLAWMIDDAHLALKGSPTLPRSLTTDLKLKASGIRVAGYVGDSADLQATIKEGLLGIESLKVNSGPNSALASGVAPLPEAWSGMAKITTDVKWQIDAPDLAALPIPNVQVSGQMAGTGTVALKEGKLAGATADVNATKLTLPQVAFSSVNAQVTTDADVVKLTSLTAKLDDAGRNNAVISGTMQVTGRQPTTVKWQAGLADLAGLMPVIKLKDTPPPEGGTVVSSGTAAFDLADFKEKNFTRATAEGNVSIDAVVWQGARLESALVNFNAREGRAELSQLFVRFDSDNQLAAKGHASLSEDRAFDAEIHGAFNKLTSLADWMKLAKAPKFTSGALLVDWQGKGKLSTKEIAGGGTVKLDDLKLEGREDAYALNLALSHEGKRAEITSLQASAGQFRAELAAAVSETELSVSKLSVFSDSLKLVEGTMKVPLVLNQQPRPKVPVDPNKPLDVHLTMDKLNFGQLFNVLRMKAPVEGSATAKVDLAGTLAKLDGKVAVALSGVRAEAVKGKLQPASATLDLTLANNRVALQAKAEQSPLKPLTITADVPYDLEKLMKDPKSGADAPLQAEVTLPPSSLEVVNQFVPAIEKITGTVGIDVKISGTVQKPEWTGTVRTDVDDLVLKNAIMDTKSVKAYLSFTGNRITLDDVSASVSGGRVKVGGTVDAANLKDPAVDLQIIAQEALIIRDETMTFRANADVDVKGTLAKGAVTGRVDLVRGRVFKEVEFLPLSLPNQLPPPPPPATRTKSGAPPGGPAMFKDWTVNVDVATKDQVRLLGNVLNGGVIVGLNAGGSIATPTLEGKVKLDGARLRLPFSRLTVSRGEITFNRENSFDPALDLQGDSRVGNYQVTVYAYGTARAPKVRLTSSPPLPEGEIATLLATGATTSDLKGSEGVAANRAAFLVLSSAYRKVFKKNAPKRYDEEPPKLSFSLNPVGTGSSAGGVTATYELSPKTQLVGSVGGDGFRGLFYYLIRLR